jgi:hypothetical protein
MRLLIVCFSLLIISFSSFSQKISTENLSELKLIEQNMKENSDSIINAKEWLQRFKNNERLIKTLVTSLKVPYSFSYKFDSVRISKLYAPDSSFRIFTWQVAQNETSYSQFGAIQMNTKDGNLKLFPLFDISDFTNHPNDSTREASRWIGAIYYQIITKTYNNKTYYTLLGRDDNNERTNKKWIDILTFNELGKPLFGRNSFVYPNDGIKPLQPCYRFNLEFRKNAGVVLRYDDKLDEIIFDKLISENNDLATKSSLIPYGDYEGFRWQNGKWYFTAKPLESIEIKEEDRINTLPKGFLEKKKRKNKF